MDPRSVWRTPSGVEVDFVVQMGKISLGIEVKSFSTWKSTYSEALKGLIAEKVITRAYGVYLGDKTLKDGPVLVLPIKAFMRHLEKGEIFAS